MRTLNFLIYNALLALLFWKGVDGNVLAQKIFSCLIWVPVFFLVFCNEEFVKIYYKLHSEYSKINIWLNPIIVFAFLVAAIYFGWLWTSLGIMLKYLLTINFKRNIKDHETVEHTEWENEYPK